MSRRHEKKKNVFSRFSPESPPLPPPDISNLLKIKKTSQVPETFLPAGLELLDLVEIDWDVSKWRCKICFVILGNFKDETIYHHLKSHRELVIGYLP
jgi:hypothetical protein